MRPSGTTNLFGLAPTSEAAPVVEPTRGEAGIQDLGSEDLFAKAEVAAKRGTLAQNAMESARRALSRHGLTRTEDRAKAGLAYKNALTAFIAAGAEEATYKRRATQAAKREDIVTTAAAKQAEDAAKKQSTYEETLQYLKDAGVSTEEPWLSMTDQSGETVPIASDTISPGAAEHRKELVKSGDRSVGALKTAKGRMDLKAQADEAKASDLADGWRDQPWAEGKSDAWIAKNGPMLHRESVKAEANRIHAMSTDAKTADAELKGRVAAAKGAYDSARGLFGELRATDYAEARPSTKKAYSDMVAKKAQYENWLEQYTPKDGRSPVGGGGDLASRVKAIEDDANMTADEKLKALDGLEK